MASSPASQGVHHRRRQNARRQPLSRTSTLFGAIKNIVTAPLSWFASTDDFKDTGDGSGKRRRLANVPTEPALEEEDMAPRTKRMRVDSPPRTLRREGAYLDPPTAAFEQSRSVGRSVSTGTQTNVAHAHTVGSAGNYVRSTLSPLRNLSISRTMSIDPPPRPQSRDGGVFQSQRPLNPSQDMDSSMESVHPLPSLPPSLAPSFPRMSYSMPRELSVSHSRPAFRMRTSLTPQPAQLQRERSEPPPLHLLRSNPTFVRPPPLEEELRAGSNEPGPTLGSLVDSVRRTQSPARQQHSSLLFAGKSQVESKPEISRSQKALHDLEIYKTPLLPTRLRNGSGQQSITGAPDLFRPRRKILLMKDEDHTSDRKLGRKETVSPDKNGTKPYAGEGGMKRMLAKRKLELEEEEDEDAPKKVEKSKGKKKDEDMETDKVQPPPSPKEIPPPPKDDWYSLASGPEPNTGGSSLRVGRAKSSRNHISRPTARSRAKFSAAFDEEVDDAMGDDEQEKRNIEEAQKKLPPFNIPAGFTFANNVKPIEHDATNAKEPPIKSLPFSFSGPAAPVAPPSEKTEAVSQPPPTTTLPFSFGKSSDTTTREMPPSLFGAPPAKAQEQQPSLIAPPSSSSSTSGPTVETPTSKGGVPNFFSRSAAFNKPLEIKTPPLSFSPQPHEPQAPKIEVNSAPAPSPVPAPAPVVTFVASASNGIPSVRPGTTSLFGSPAPVAPVKDTANPFWDGEKKLSEGGLFDKPKQDEPQSAPVSIFGAAGEKKPEQTKTSAPVNLFGDPSKATAATNPFSLATTKPATESDAKPALNFSAPTSTTSLFGSKPTTERSSTQPAPSLFGSQPSSGTANTGFVSSTGGSLFGSSATAASDAPKPATSLFGAAPQPATEAPKPTDATSTTASSTSLFSFGQSQAAPPSVEAPKPAVANGSAPAFGSALPPGTKLPSPIPFIFGPREKDAKATSPAPFAGFGGAPDKDTKAGSPAPFAFGGPSTPSAEKTAPFTFGTPTSSPVPSALFQFGAGGSTAGDISKPPQVERPTTPKNDQEFKMEESPTREVQQSNNANKQPGFTGFTFGNPPSTGSVLFGGPTSAPPTTTPFPFSSNSSNPFSAPPMKESKSEGPKPFTFGQSASPAPPTTTGFNFGQTSQTGGESPRPSSSGAFNFGPGTPTSATSGFNFGQSPSTNASNPFAPQSTGSAPSSPSTFQTGAFNFGGGGGGTNASGSTPFAFGSQPASPATGATNLPQATTPVTFGSGNTGFGSAPSSPFSAPTQIAPSTSSGGTLFTIGAAPPPQQGQGGRAIKKLPQRRKR